jgi:hypothetical protein
LITAKRSKQVSHFFTSLYKKFQSYKRRVKAIKNYKVKLTLVFIHAVMLVFFTLLLQYITFTRGDETGFLKWASILKHNILDMDEKPAEDSIVFIDVSKDVVTIDDPELSYDGNDSLQGARTVIKDRKKLSVFFNGVNKHPDAYKFILCDILFQDASANDSALQAAIEPAKNILTTSIFSDGKLIQPIFNVASGCVNYSLLNGSLFTKMPLVYSDTIKSLSVLMYERLTKNIVTHKNGITYFNGRISFNTIIPELYYRPYDLRRSEAHGKPANLFYLGELITRPDFFKNFLQNKYIIVGDFANDNHNTYFGAVPGCLLLIDTFFTLRNHPPVISFAWLLILFFVYCIVSYFMFIHPEKKFKELQEKIKFRFMKQTIIRYISFIGLMMLLDWVSYFFYSTFISIFYIASYLTFLQIAIDKYKPVTENIKKYMRKFKLVKTAVLFILLLTSKVSFTQTYSVSAVRGNVYWNSKLLKNGDVLTNPETLTSDNTSSKIRLLNPQTGSILVSFANSKPAIQNSANKHSELYTITIQPYISSYGASRVLTTKGDFDWVLFFVDSCKGRMAVFEDEKIPLTSTHIQLDSSVRFMAITNMDTGMAFKNIPVINDSLVFAGNIFPPGKPVTWKLALSYSENNKTDTSVINDTPIVSQFITADELKQLIVDFTENWRTNYKDEKEAKNDFYSYLFFNYGAFYNGNIDKIINAALIAR